MKAGHNQTEIARVVGVHKSTISRELKRNRGLRGYWPNQAQRLADNRRRDKSCSRIPELTWAWVERLLGAEWSPEQISGWLALEKGLSINHEWIYLYVYQDKHRGGDLYRHLCCQKARRKYAMEASSAEVR